VNDVADVLGHRFSDPALVEKALTHASLARERDGGCGNERLEFLGDAALDAVISRALFETHPDWEEGELTRARARLVNGSALAALGRQLGFGAHMLLGRSELRSRGREKTSILANVFEALIGALYLDAGLDPVEHFLRRVIPEAWDPQATLPERDPKTRLNEWSDRHAERPYYRVLRDSGEEHADDRFEVVVEIEGCPVASGVGRTKRAAEGEAAARTLEKLAGRDE